MSDEDVRTVRSGFEAFGRGDVDGLLDLVHEEVDASFLLGPILGVDAIHGKDALRRFVADQLFEAFDEFSAETLSFEDLGGEVLALVHLRAHGEGSGVRLDESRAFVATLVKGRIAAIREYRSRDEALEAARD